MEAFLVSSVLTILYLNKITLNMGPLRQLLSRLLYPFVATIGFLLTFPLWRIMRDRRIRRDEESDLSVVGSDDPCNAATRHVDADSMDDSEVPVAGQSAQKRVTNTDEDAGEMLKRLKVEENDLTEDELYCEYDSTWETSASSELKSSSNKRVGRQRRTNYKFDRFKNAARDMWNYRHDYPGKSNHRSRHQEPQMPNLEFYIGNIPSAPDGIYIDEFHSDWFEDYYRLEYVHTFIQWLFPLQEPGVNYQAKELTKEEIQTFCKDPIAKRNLLGSYKLMLDFYGINLSNEETGEVVRASNWAERSDHLNSHTHNFLRISRILKCLGTLGYSHYQAPLVHFFLEETLVHGNLSNMKESLLNYYMFAVLDKKARQALIRFAYLNYDHQEEFVWCPKTIQMRWLKESLPYANPPSEVNNQDDKAIGTTDKAQDFWSSTSKPSADASPSMNEDPKNLTNSDTSPGITDPIDDSEFESQGDKADANVSKSNHGSTTEQTVEGGHQVPLKKVHSSSTATDSNKQDAPPAHSLSAEAVIGQERSLPGEDLQGNSERNEEATHMSAAQSDLLIHREEPGHYEDMAADKVVRGLESRLPSTGTHMKLRSTSGSAASEASPPGPEHQMNKNTGLRVQKDLDSVSPSAVGGGDGDDKPMEVPRNQMNPNEESGSIRNAEEGQRNEEDNGESDEGKGDSDKGESDCDDDL